MFPPFSAASYYTQSDFGSQEILFSFFTDFFLISFFPLQTLIILNSLFIVKKFYFLFFALLFQFQDTKILIILNQISEVKKFYFLFLLIFSYFFFSVADFNYTQFTFHCQEILFSFFYYLISISRHSEFLFIQNSLQLIETILKIFLTPQKKLRLLIYSGIFQLSINFFSFSYSFLSRSTQGIINYYFFPLKSTVILTKS